MVSAKSFLTLKVEKGKNRDKIFHFTQDQVVIGRSASCDLILEDDSVSRQHATITFDGESFVIQDSSTNGTFVNGSRIRTSQKLFPDDVIGIGPDNLLRYEQRIDGAELPEEHQGNVRTGPKALSDVTKRIKSLLGQKPMLAAGLGIYLGFLLLLLFYLALSPSGGGRITIDEANRLVKETRLFLVNSPSPDKGARLTTNLAQGASLLSEGKSLEAIEGVDPGANYFVLSKYIQALRLCGFYSLSEYERVKKESGAAAEVPDEVVKALEGALKRILSRIEELVFLGWLAEANGRRDEAIRIYEKVLAILPEENAPSYRFALSRIRDLKG